MVEPSFLAGRGPLILNPNFKNAALKIHRWSGCCRYLTEKNNNCSMHLHFPVLHVAEKEKGHPCLVLCNIAFTLVWVVDESATNGAPRRHVNLGRGAKANWLLKIKGTLNIYIEPLQRIGKVPWPFKTKPRMSNSLYRKNGQRVQKGLGKGTCCSFWRGVHVHTSGLKIKIQLTFNQVLKYKWHETRERFSWFKTVLAYYSRGVYLEGGSKCTPTLPLNLWVIKKIFPPP